MTDLARPLLVTDDPILVEAVLGVAAAAGVVMDVAVDLRAARPRWRSAPCVLVGHDVRPVPGLAHRVDVVMVSTDLDDATVWARAAGLRCEHVVFLPDADAWLEARLRRATGAADRDAQVIAVLGGRGGAGASVIAAALAYTAWRADWRVALVDADPWSGGLDLMFNLDGSDAHDGRLDLVVREREGGRGRDLLTIVEEHRSGRDLVVVDLPRGDRLECEVGLLVADTGLLVVPTEVRAVVGAHAMRTWAADACSDLRLVTRTVRRGVGPEVVTTSLGLPVAGILPSERSVEEDLDRGEPPAARRGALRRWAEDFLLELDAPASRVAS